MKNNLHLGNKFGKWVVLSFEWNTIEPQEGFMIENIEQEQRHRHNFREFHSRQFAALAFFQIAAIGRHLYKSRNSRRGESRARSSTGFFKTPNGQQAATGSNRSQLINGSFLLDFNLSTTGPQLLFGKRTPHNSHLLFWMKNTTFH